MKKLVLLLLLSGLCVHLRVHATCTTGQNEIIVQIVPDGYPNEISWSITDSTGTIVAIGASVGDTICIADGACMMFTIQDSYGDGILNPGGYYIYMNSILVASGGDFGSVENQQLNCPIGMHCTNPLPLAMGTTTSQFDDTWYSYVAATSGTYNLTTCGSNTCDTKIWVYNTCPAFPYDEGPPGTFAFNDDNNCGSQANLNVVFMAGTTYSIRIGDNNNTCPDPINFEFSYVGPIQGCMDPAACNYNPLAVVDDGSCIYYPNPLCAGPDLELDSAAFMNSLNIRTTNAGTCDIDEGCVTGYGTRYVISFSSKINNIGTLDYTIGNPSANPSMFNTNNCHGHSHYEGYGDYRLFDSNGNLVPSGHKNGFCVMDLCGFGHFSCGDMGISVGCYDQYGAGTQCQWLDITDVPDGDYRVAAIINSHHLPDALGHQEINYLNNALQVCMHISRNTSGVPSYTLLPNCAPFTDCAGIPAGTGEPDCNNICNGPGVFGDTYSDATLDAMDVSTYLDLIEANLPATTCYDLNADASLSVFDAALINWCMHGNPAHPGGSFHNHCRFPRNIVNPNDAVGLSIANVNFTDNYVDVAVLNPTAKIGAYEFIMSGINITSVISLANPVNFPVDVRFMAPSGKVFAISTQDSMLERSSTAQSLVRIYFDAVTDDSICISSITDLINQDAEQTTFYLYDNCRSSVPTGISAVLKPAGIVIMPNPAKETALISLSENAELGKDLFIVDASGRTITLPINKIRDSHYEMDVSGLPTGVYFVTMKTHTTFGVARFVKM